MDARRHKQRRGARVIVRARDAAGRTRVLLFADTDPGVPGSQWWVTPGGGLDRGETDAQAAVRELFEETGLQADEAQLRGPVGRRVAVHGYSDQVLEQDEVFFLLDVDQFEVDTSGFTESEQATMVDYGWFGAAELAGMEVWPEHLVDLLAWNGEPEADWGRVEESTMPVAGGAGATRAGR